MDNETKKCPYCGEEILKEAKKCKHCGEWLVLQEKDIPKSSIYIGLWIELIIGIILIICIFMCNFNYNDGIVFGILISYILLHLYFLPTIIADKKRTRYTIAIFALNLLLGLTVVVWVGCLIWALMLPDLSKYIENEK